jgi:hypothetical protein
MAKGKPTEAGILQIRVNDPAIIRKFKVYAASNDLSHGELLTKAFLLLEASEGSTSAEE